MGNKMKVQQMAGKNGPAKNQFIIYGPEATYFQSYNSIIVKTGFNGDEWEVLLDYKYWDYSKTTAKYRNQFLGCTTKEVVDRIRSCEYKLDDLNK